MSTSIKRTLALRDQYAERMRDVFSRCESFKESFTWHLNETHSFVLDQPAYRKLPRWAKGYVEGVRDQLQRELYSKLEWRMKLDGVYVNAKQIPEGAWSRVRVGCHFWPGSDRPYGELKDES